MNTSSQSLLCVVACALIDVDGRVLLAQRPPHTTHAGKWEFPGGKVKEGESPESALMRELWEELGIEPCKRCYQPFGFRTIRRACDELSPEDKQGDNTQDDLVLLLYLCRQWDGFLKAREKQKLRWCLPREMLALDLLSADVELARALYDELTS